MCSADVEGHESCRVDFRQKLDPLIDVVAREAQVLQCGPGHGGEQPSDGIARTEVDRTITLDNESLKAAVAEKLSRSFEAEWRESCKSSVNDGRSSFGPSISK